MIWWQDDLDASIACYPDHLEDGAAACERALSRPGLPDGVEDAIRKNATWYAPVFPAAVLWQGEGFNPSVAVTPEGEYAMVVRRANYRIHPGGRYEIPPADDGVIKTTNFLADLCVDADRVEVGPLSPLDDAAIVNPDHPFPVWGLEDARLFWRGGWW